MNTQQLKEAVLNKKFTRLYVYDVEIGPDNRLLALCRCDCGKEVKIKASKVKAKLNKSCGCLMKEHLSSFIGNHTRGKQPAHTKPTGEAAMNYVYKNYKTSAKKRKLSFNLLKEDFSRLTKLDCHYCNLAPSTVMKGQDKSRKLNGDYIYNGLDRVDSNKGYELENVVTCCERCNRLKSDLVSYEEFIEFIKVLKLKRGDKIW